MRDTEVFFIGYFDDGKISFHLRLYFSLVLIEEKKGRIIGDIRLGGPKKKKKIRVYQ